MLREMPQSLIRCLAAALLSIGTLLLLDAGVTYTADTSMVGDQVVVCADEWASMDDPEAPVVGVDDANVDVGYDDPPPPNSSLPGFKRLLPTPLPRAPPVS